MQANFLQKWHSFHDAQRHQNFFNKTFLQNETDLAVISARNRNTAHTQRYCPLNKDGKYNGEGPSHTDLKKKKNVAGSSVSEFGEESLELQNEGSDEEIVVISASDESLGQVNFEESLDVHLTGNLLDDPPLGDMFDMESSEDDEDIMVVWDRKGGQTVITID